MFIKGDLANGMINTFVIETLLLVFALVIISNLLELDRSKKIQIALIFAIKFLLFNPGTTYIRYLGYEREPYTYWMGIGNFFIVIMIFALTKIVTRESYTVVIGILTLLGDVLSGALYMLPYEAMVASFMKNGPIFFGEDFSIKGFLIYLCFVAYGIGIIILTNKITKKFGDKILRFIKRAKIAVWIFFIIDIGIGTFAFMIKAIKNDWYIVFYYIVSIALGALIMYEASLYARKKKTKEVVIENADLNTENEAIKEYYKTLSSGMEEDRKFRHDLDKHMNVIKEMVDEGASEKEVKKYAETIKETYK